MGVQAKDLDKDCPKCGKQMMRVNVKSLPKSSEFYCKPCHWSEKMDEQVAVALNQMEKGGGRG